MMHVLYHNDLHGNACLQTIKHETGDDVIGHSCNFACSNFKVPEDDSIIVCGLYPSVGTVQLWIDMGNKVFLYSCSINDIIKYKELEGEITLTIRTNNSPLESIWEDITKGKKELPKLHKLIGSYHSWNFNSPEDEDEAKALVYTLRHMQTGLNSNVYEFLLDSKRLQCHIFCGYEILDYDEHRYDEYAKNLTYYTNLKIKDMTYNILAANTRGDSSIFGKAYGNDRVNVYALYRRTKYGKYRVTLYSANEKIDVSRIANHFGGGGKFEVASFFCNSLPFKELARPNYDNAEVSYIHNRSDKMCNPPWVQRHRNKLSEIDRSSFNKCTTINDYKVMVVNSTFKQYVYYNPYGCDVEMAYYWASDGTYRFVITLLSSKVDINKLKKVFNGEIENGVVVGKMTGIPV